MLSWQNYGLAVTELADKKIRSKIEAMVLNGTAKATHDNYGERMASGIGSMAGTVVELGPGPGLTMKYYAPGTRVIGIEPNPSMHEGLRAAATEHGVDLEIRTLRGEQIDVESATADGVVGTRVLCGVDDPDEVVSEVLRVLKPGAPYFFLEHVAAPEGTRTATAQRVLLRPHRWLFNGCEINRTTANTISAGGFTDVQIEEVDEGLASGHVRHHIVGTATK